MFLLGRRANEWDEHLKGIVGQRLDFTHAYMYSLNVHKLTRLSFWHRSASAKCEAALYSTALTGSLAIFSLGV